MKLFYFALAFAVVFSAFESYAEEDSVEVTIQDQEIDDDEGNADTFLVNDIEENNDEPKVIEIRAKDEDQASKLYALASDISYTHGYGDNVAS